MADPGSAPDEQDSEPIELQQSKVISSQSGGATSGVRAAVTDEQGPSPKIEGGAASTGAAVREGEAGSGPVNVAALAREAHESAEREAANREAGMRESVMSDAPSVVISSSMPPSLPPELSSGAHVEIPKSPATPWESAPPGDSGFEQIEHPSKVPAETRPVPGKTHAPTTLEAPESNRLSDPGARLSGEMPQVIPPPTIDPVLALLEWTADMDEERAASLWLGLSRAADAVTRAQAVTRWVEWSGAPVPAGVHSVHLAEAAGEWLDVLDAIGRGEDSITEYDLTARPALCRAMRAWVRTREGDLAAVLRGLAAVYEEEREGRAPLAGAAERTALAGMLRRHARARPCDEGAPVLLALARLDARAQVFPPALESTHDFALLMGDATASYPRALAELAPLPAWRNTLRLGLESVGRGALRAARMLCALGAHPAVALTLDEGTARDVVAAFDRALLHPRQGVWSRAARAAGRLSGSLEGIDEVLTRWLDPATPVTARRRAHAALGTLRATATPALLAKRAEAWGGAQEPWLVASFALGLSDRACDTRAGASVEPWEDAARTYAARGGPESWATLLVALREIVGRAPHEADRARKLVSEVRNLARAHKSTSPADAELVERVMAIAGRISGPDGASEVTPASLLTEVALRADRDPADAGVSAAIEELAAHTDQTLGGALRAIAQDNTRTVARASVMLEETLDLVVDGDVAVLAERLSDEGARVAARNFADGLRTRLLRAVWTGLRRPTPAIAAWRRWLLRAASVLPRVEPANARAEDRDRVVRGQVLDTLARLADDPSLAQAPLQRYVLAAIDELSAPLASTLGTNAPLTVLVWMALRNAALPARTRARGALDGVPAERIEQLYLLCELFSRPGRAGAKELGQLAELAGKGHRLANMLAQLSTRLHEVSTRPPEPHWSGLPRLELGTLATLGDGLRRARDDAAFALSNESLTDHTTSTAENESLAERAAKLERALTSTSLKFVDGSRRAEIVEHYVQEVGALCESIATACGPLVGPPVRAALARAQVALRAEAARVAAEKGADAKYIGRLRVLNALATDEQGGMSSTYLAEGPAPGKRVVVKLSPWGPGAAARDLFEREMNRLASITHPNVVSIIDAGFVDEGAYIALEYIPGASLETVLRVGGPMPLARLAPVVRDVARGLAYLHGRAVVHRDIKPGNILVQYDGLEGAPTGTSLARAEFVRSVVIDLGIAAEGKGGSTVNEGEGLVGTPGYLAPEIARGLEVVTPAIDVYALAVVVFEALTGQNPFLEGAPELMALLVRHGTMTLPLEILPDEAQKPAIRGLLREASALEPQARPSMKEFLRRWNEALGA